jgi:hypothetical protein
MPPKDPLDVDGIIRSTFSPVKVILSLPFCYATGSPPWPRHRYCQALPQAVRASGDSTRRTSKPAGAERRPSAGRRQVCQGGDDEAWFREEDGLSVPLKGRVCIEEDGCTLVLL